MLRKRSIFILATWESLEMRSIPLAVVPSAHLLALVHQVLKALESNFNTVHTKKLISI